MLQRVYLSASRGSSDSCARLTPITEFDSILVWDHYHYRLYQEVRVKYIIIENVSNVIKAKVIISGGLWLTWNDEVTEQPPPHDNAQNLKRIKHNFLGILGCFIEVVFSPQGTSKEI